MSDAETESTSTRWQFTNDVLAGILVAFAVGLTAAYVAEGQTIPMWLATADAVAILTAVAWAFGRGAFSAASKVVGGND